MSSPSPSPLLSPEGGAPKREGGVRAGCLVSAASARIGRRPGAEGSLAQPLTSLAAGRSVKRPRLTA